MNSNCVTTPPGIYARVPPTVPKPQGGVDFARIERPTTVEMQDYAAAETANWKPEKLNSAISDVSGWPSYVLCSSMTPSMVHKVYHAVFELLT